MTTRRENDLLNRLRSVESLSSAMGFSKVSIRSPGARKPRCRGSLESPFLPPHNQDETPWQDLKTIGVGRHPAERAKEPYGGVTVRMDTLKGLARTSGRLSRTHTHTIYA